MSGIAALLLASAALVLQPENFPSASISRTVSVSGTIRNAGTAAIAAELIVELPAGVRLQRIEQEHFAKAWSCNTTATAIVCTRPSFAPKESYFFNFYLTSDEGTGRETLIPITLRSVEQTERANGRVIWRRPFRVTSTDDSGAGSLRQAIDDLNANCRGAILCDVVFDLPTPATIEPLTPLPAITGCGFELRADAPSAPRDADRRVALSGAKLRQGHGLELRTTCNASSLFTFDLVSGLAVGDFPWNGIHVAPPIVGTYAFHNLFLGTDITGTIARPNDRGLVIDAAVGNPRLSDSILSGNRRSGLYVAGKAFIEAERMRIGVGRDGRPLPNGASGIYIGDGGVGVDANSVIAYNAHFGVAIRPGASGAIYGSVHSNGVQAIDRGLDGPTPNRDDDRYPGTPTITSALFDVATNETVVRVSAPMRHWEWATLAIYANRARNASGRAEMERLLAQSIISRRDIMFPNTATDWAFRIPGDLRGEILTAVVHYDPWGDAPPASEYSSEVSEGVAVR